MRMRAMALACRRCPAKSGTWAGTMAAGTYLRRFSYRFLTGAVRKHLRQFMQCAGSLHLNQIPGDGMRMRVMALAGEKMSGEE
jgi:hypothetical protein